jgi:exodeoxyribonuclease-3
MSSVKIITWNVNSVRARLPHLTLLLEREKPDLVLLQEIKCLENQFPLESIEALGYNVYLCGQKARNGVAILSKYPLEDVVYALENPVNILGLEGEARYVEGFLIVKNIPIRVASIYVPNGGVCAKQAHLGLAVDETERFFYKMSFLENLKHHFLTRQNSSKYADEIQVFGGDYNVAPSLDDMYDPRVLDGTICCHPLEREKWGRVLNETGLTDALPSGNFTWWDYRLAAFKRNLGMRIDHFLVSHKNYIKKASVLAIYRGLERPSDHAPVSLEINI